MLTGEWAKLMNTKYYVLLVKYRFNYCCNKQIFIAEELTSHPRKWHYHFRFSTQSGTNQQGSHWGTESHLLVIQWVLVRQLDVGIRRRHDGAVGSALLHRRGAGRRRARAQLRPHPILYWTHHTIFTSLRATSTFRCHHPNKIDKSVPHGSKNQICFTD